MKEKRVVFTQILAVAGTVLVWIPLLAPVFFSVMFLIRSGMFRMDYLMPAELFLVALIGGALLIWAALRARQASRFDRWGVRRGDHFAGPGKRDRFSHRLGYGRDRAGGLAMVACPGCPRRLLPCAGCRGRGRDIIAV